MGKTLLKSISSSSNLHSAWNALNKSNPDSTGLSGESISSVRENISPTIESIQKKLRAGKYIFSSTKAVVIPKDNGKPRPLRVPEVKDRIVMKSIAMKLEKELDDILSQGSGVSFAYQKGIGIKQALFAVKSYYDRGYPIALKCDIEKFFDMINRERLLEDILFPSLKDDSINGLVSSSLNQKVGNVSSIKKAHRKLFEDTITGIPQGNPLSPLFANIYLADFDQFMKEKGFQLIRYADDALVMCRTREEANDCFRDVKDFLSSIDLNVHPIEKNGKSEIIDIDDKPLTFLSILFDGLELYPSRPAVDRLLEDKLRSKFAEENLSLLEVLKSINNIINGWVASYAFTKVENYAGEIDTYINRNLVRSIERTGIEIKNRSLGKAKYKFRKNDSSDSRILKERQRNLIGVDSIPTILDRVRDDEEVKK